MAKNDLEVPRRSIAFYKVLSVYLEHPNKAFTGAEIMELTGLKSGTTYPLLARLVTHRWLKASWEKVDPNSSSRPPRRLYSLTKGGRAKAKEMRNTESTKLKGFIDPSPALA